MYRELNYDRVVSRVKGLQFCVLSDEEIRRRSVCEVTETQPFNANEPVVGGLFDTRMGVIDSSKTCATCLQRATFCPGHFGHVTLARPVFYIQFFDIVRKIMQCVCFRCSKILVDLDGPEARAILSRKTSRQRRWDAMNKLCAKVKRCGQETLDGCGAKQPDRVSKTDDLRVKLVWKTAQGVDDDISDVREQIYSAEDVLRVLRRISDGDADALGFSPELNRPEWMVCTTMLVPPPAVRPSVRTDTGQRQEDDLTHKLSDIVKYNNALRDRISKGASRDMVDHFVYMLQYHVATLIDNSVPSLRPSQDRAGRMFRSLNERLKHKDGRIRGNLMGKRVDFSARTVITPDPNLSIDELGVPYKIAMNLTFPVVVNSHNIEFLQKLVANGPSVYPGAKHVRKVHGQGQTRTIRLKGHPDPGSIVLEPDDIVERHLLNGDYVLFNRQPSLHKMSMMAHRVRVMEYNTFRLNVCVCASYNADFDGDEMNMHVPQSLQTHHEIKELAAVPLHIISPRYSTPIVTIVQDVALGVFRITQSAVRVTERQLMNLVASNGTLDPTLLPEPVDPDSRQWSGRQILSTVLPPAISVRMTRGDRGADDFIEEDDDIRIENGVIKNGVLSADNFGKASRGLVHATYNTLGPAAVTTMLNNTQKLICSWLVFSVGVSDVVVRKEVNDIMRNKLLTAKNNVYELLQKVHTGAFENVSTKSDAEYLEEQIGAALSKGQEEAGKQSRSGFTKSNNRMLNMIASGSKGKIINFTQMVASLGPQSIDNKRVPDGFGSRTLPHYTKFDDGPESRGFVENSFIQGLAPQEFFFHSMAGRIGLIDTAVRSVTRETPVVIMERGRCKYVLIGDWIDSRLDSIPIDSSRLKVYPEDKNMELLDIGEQGVYIPTVDADGKVTWGHMTAVTRHDPGKNLYRVKTLGGREVTVAESQSLLVWNSDAEKFEQRDSRLVKPGDFLPVTAQLAAPPIVTNKVDVSEYLKKTEHVYGTDFHRAVRMVAEAQGKRFAVPKGFWKKHNGVDFTLPYEKKSLLTRVTSGRSNVEGIKEGCVYPFHATRCHGHMPDSFELDEEFGTFIGLYLADGHCHEKSGMVGVTKNEPEVQAWVKAWFEKHSFTTRLQENTNYLGTSYTLVGHSTLLARFLDAFVGHGAKDKHVPDVAFAAPDDFVRGILSGYFSGYFSGDGAVANGAITSSSVSYRLSEGIAMLCSRIGAFAKMSFISPPKATNLRVDVDTLLPAWRLSIRAKWAKVLTEKLNLVHIAKREKLAELRTADKHKNYESVNDIVLDAVASIEAIPTDEHPKLYDVTVPSTLNFCLANGLGVRDTSETGYLQRRLIKAMEDCKIHHDLTVRNASGFIIQFLYGDDGMDAIKLEFHKLPHVSYETNLADVRKGHLITAPEELTGFSRREIIDGLSSSPEKMKRLEDHYKSMLIDRRRVIMGLCGGLSDEKPIVYPVNISRIVDETADIFKSVGGMAALSDLDPLRVLDVIEALSKELVVGHVDQLPADVPTWMPILLRTFLSPKQLIVKKNLNSTAFDRVVARIRQAFFDALAPPAEMVGIVAAQSVGEPTTQLSVESSARVLIRGGKTADSYSGAIGEYIDRLIEKHKDRVVDLGGDSVVLDMPAGEDHYVIGVSNEEKTSWRRIKEVSRHPANGGMVTIKTKSGKSTCATLSHSFLKRTESGIAPTKGSDLKVGDRVPVARSIPQVENPMYSVQLDDGTRLELTKDLGWFFGAYLADGCINGTTISISKVIPEYQDKLRNVIKTVFGRDMRQDERQGTGTLQGWDMSKYRGMDNKFSHAPLSRFLTLEFRTGSFNKRLPAWVYTSNIDFISGLISGYFDGDGNVNSSRGKQMIRSASVSEGLTEDFILLLAFVGIFASKCRETHFKEASRSDLFTTQIPRKYARAFKERVGLCVREKSLALDEVIEYVEREDAHSQKEEIDMIPELGDALAFVGKVAGVEGQSRTYGRYAKKEAIGRETLRKYVDELTLALETKEVAFTEHTESVGGKLDALEKYVSSLQPGKRDSVPLTSEVGNLIGDIAQSLPGSKTVCYAQYAKRDRIGVDTLTGYLATFEKENAAIPEGPDYMKNDKLIAHLREVLSNAEPDARGIIKMTAETTGKAIASLGSSLKPGVSYAQWRSKTSTTLKTLTRILSELRAFALEDLAEGTQELREAAQKLQYMRQACEGDVIWDEIVEIEHSEDPKEYVYDLTVPGNDSFMVDCGILVHNTLNTFHLSGAASASAITQGVPRMKELMSMSKSIKTPAMTIKLRPEYASSMERAKEVLANIQTTRIRDLVKKSSVHFDPSDAETTIEADRGLVNFYREFSADECPSETSPWLLRFEFDRMKMLDAQVTMVDIEATLLDFYDDAVSCVLSDDNARELVCRLRLRTDGAAKEDGIDTDVLTEIKALEQAIMENGAVVVKGVPGIEKAVLSPPNAGLKKYDEVMDTFVSNDAWSILTAGSNMKDVMRNDYVDYKNTLTNDVYEVFNVLGIEGARSVLIIELRTVIGELPLDHRHLSLLADTMTNRGFFMSIDRHGINHRGELGPLAKCSFEETTDMLIKAGVFGERDRINGVSANIMLGQVAPCGTGDTEVLVDIDALTRVAKPVDVINSSSSRQQEQKLAEETPAVNATTTKPVMPSLTLPSEGKKKRAARPQADEIEIV